MSKGQPFTDEDIPMEMRRRFEDLRGKPTGFVLVFSAVALDHGDKLDNFVKELVKITDEIKQGLTLEQKISLSKPRLISEHLGF